MIRKIAGIFRSLEARGARYLLVGGVAVGAYGLARATQDVDLFIPRERENAEAVLKALRDAGVETAGQTDADAVIEHDILALDDFVRVDLLSKLPGLAFEEAWERRTDRKVGGVPVHLVGLDDLIRAKEAAGREVDRMDVKELRVVRQKRGKS